MLFNTHEIVRKNYTVTLEEPTVYVDNEKRGRSGHMTHALAEFAPGQFINFNSSCSNVRLYGHSAFGFVEYRISRDSGKTYSDVYELEYSKKTLMDGLYSISVEKAVACKNGRLVAFCLRNTQVDPVCCEPWISPMYIVSDDQGESWSQPKELSPYEGRPYDALYHDGSIYVLHYCNPHFLGTKPEHVYRIYKSDDDGESFYEHSVIPFDTTRRGYGSIIFDEKGILHAYAYNEGDECHMDHAVSSDCGKTWSVLEPCFLAHGIRNPQTGFVDGVFVLHGRAKEVEGFVLYTSEDATNWDEGCMLINKKGGGAYYSNNLTLRDENGSFLLVQFSHPYAEPATTPYELSQVNVMHTRLRILKNK